MGAFVATGVIASIISTVVFLSLAGRTTPTTSRRGIGAAATSRVLLPLVPLCVAAVLLSPWARARDLAIAVAILWAGSLGWMRLTRRWSAWAHTGWSLTALAGCAYVIAMAAWTVTSGLGWLALVGATVLWVLEVFAWLLLLAYGWEIFDVIGSRSWQRRIQPVAAGLAVGDAAPFVSVHVPSHNEPPEMLLETLESLRRLDYPAYEILVIDNNTTDATLWEPIEAYCRWYPDLIKFHRLVDWPGFKSGALNYAEEHTDPRATIIGVVDADYQVEPSWLRETVGAFADSHVGFVQTPQDYRDWNHAAYLRRLYYSYDYFFSVSQPSRDERNGAIFGGTMGLVRREALLDVGRWDEWCVTEDAELSLRMFQRGWTGHHLDHSYGLGIMPLTFEALKRQRFRWCFGGMQILKRHWRSLMPWDRSTQLTGSQKLAYLSGGLQWFGDLLAVLFAFVVMTSLVDVAFGGGLIARRLSGLLLVAVPSLIGLGLVRAVAVVKTVGRGISWRDALGVFMVWLSLGWVVSMACVRGLVEPEGVFLRTPKFRGEARWLDAIRGQRAEMALAAAAVASAAIGLSQKPGVTTAALTALLVLPLASWLAAPLHSIAAMRADLPEILRRRRSSERTRGWWRTRESAVSLATVVGIGVVVGMMALVIQPGSTQSPKSAVSPRLPGSDSAPGGTTGPTPGTTASSGSTSGGPTGPATTGPTATRPVTTTPQATAPTAPATTRPGTTPPSLTGSPTVRPTGSPTTIKPTPTHTAPSPTTGPH